MAYVQFDDILYSFNVPRTSALLTGSHISYFQTQHIHFELILALAISEIVILLPGQRTARSSAEGPDLVVEPCLLPQLLRLRRIGFERCPLHSQQAMLFQGDTPGITKNSER